MCSAKALIGERCRPGMGEVFAPALAASIYGRAERAHPLGPLLDRLLCPWAAVPSHQDVIREAAEWAIEELSKRP